MKDILGNELNVGDTVVHITIYGAALDGKERVIKEITKSRIYFTDSVNKASGWASSGRVVKLKTAL